MPFKSWIGLVVANCALLAQTVTVTPGDWSTHGIELTPYASPDFTPKISADPPPSSAVVITGLYPVSFALTNNTGRKILAYSAMWKLKDAAGKITWKVRQSGSLRSSNFSGIASGADKLVMPIQPPSELLMRNAVGVGIYQNAVSSELKSFAGKAEVTASLEAIVLEDGLALGPDNNNAIPRWRAEADGQKSMATEVLAAFNSGGNQAMLDLLHGIADTPRLHAPPSLTPSPDEVYKWYSANFRPSRARAWIGLAANNPDRLLALANQLAAEKQLVLHREDAR